MPRVSCYIRLCSLSISSAPETIWLVCPISVCWPRQMEVSEKFLSRKTGISLYLVNECCFGNPRQCWILDSTLWILCQWNLDSGFIRLWDSGFLGLYSQFQRRGFHISQQNLLDSGFHRQEYPEFRNPDSLWWVSCCWAPSFASAVFWFPQKLLGKKLQLFIWLLV